VEIVATEENYLFRTLGVHWNVKFTFASLERTLGKCVL
jgi:hypothetical protein